MASRRCPKLCSSFGFLSHVPAMAPRVNLTFTTSMSSEMCECAKQGFSLWFLTSNCDSSFKVGSEASIFPVAGQQQGATLPYVNFILMASRMCPAMTLEIWVSGDVQLTTTPTQSLVGATLSPHSAFSWVTFPAGSTCPAASFHVISCVPHLESIRDVHLDLHINKFAFGSEASIYSEKSPKRCQLRFSTSILAR